MEQIRMSSTRALIRVFCLTASVWLLPPALMAQNPEGLSMLAPANLNKPRPAAPFDVTGSWSWDGSFAGAGFDAPDDLVLTPYGQGHYDAAMKAAAEGKVYRNDIGLCWPIGMPIMMLRAWPVHMIQLPTGIYMVQELMNELRVIFMDGREHTDPDIAVPSFAGESIGRWEGDTLVIETTNFVDERHWINERRGMPGSDQLRITERIRMVDADTLQDEFTFEDPKVFVGTWSVTKQMKRTNDRDLQEVRCLPDLNDHMPTTQAEEYNVRE
jgi:hypothetical protein